MTLQKSAQSQFPEVRIVEASAGSGKTYTLAKRYVQLLLNPALKFEHIPIRNILAITFTNKAALEMKERILEFLKKIALKQLSPSEEETILKPIGLDGERASRKAFLIMESLIRNYNFFQVQTIDKFINALLSGCAFKIGLTANFRIKTNSKEYLQYALDQLIDEAPHRKDLLKVFNEFLHHYLYLENRTGWFPKDDILGILYTLFDESNTYGMNFQASPIKSSDLMKKKQKIFAMIQELKKELPEGTNANFTKSLDKFLKNHGPYFDIDAISDYFAWEEIPVKKDTKIPRSIEKLWQSIHSELKELCEEEAHFLFNPYVAVFDDVQKRFEELSAKDDVLFLGELNKKAKSLFSDDGMSVEELYYRLATRFRHYLIDEFQDTSWLQWNNLKEMAQEALSTGGSLFYVGDRKQAIYGFRGGNVELFDSLQDKFKAYNVTFEPLLKNWRSQRAIVEFNNSLFSSENFDRFFREKEVYELSKNKRDGLGLLAQDCEDIKKNFALSQQEGNLQSSQGYVKVEYVDISAKEEREDVIRDKVLNLIQDLQGRFLYRQIAILTRSNHQVEQLTNWLLQENIPVESERTLNIKENSLIQEFIYFLQFLNSPIDNIAFANFILGDLFSKVTGLSSQELHQFVFEYRLKTPKVKDHYLYMEFRQKYPQIWQQFIEEFFKNVGLYPLYELVVSMYYRLNCLRAFSEYQGFLMHFLEIIKKQEDDHSDISSFLDYFDRLEGEELYVRVADSDAVKIMTIHKSKGLEFPVVILPYLGMDIQVGSSGSDQQQSYILQQDESSQTLSLLRLKTKYLNFSESLKKVYLHEYKKALLAELNNMYVALTRPQVELYGFIPQKMGQSFNLAKFFIPETNYETGTRSQNGLTLKKTPQFFKLPSSQYHDWIQYLKDEFLANEQIQYREERLKGEMIHFILSQIGNLYEADKKEAVKNALATAQMHFSALDQAHYQKYVKELLDHKELKSFFEIPDGEIFTEKVFVDKKGHAKRMDRLIVLKNEVWVVDYKSARNPEVRYETQVQEYCGAVASLYPEKTIKGFIIYLDALEIEEIKAEGSGDARRGILNRVK